MLRSRCCVPPFRYTPAAPMLLRLMMTIEVLKTPMPRRSHKPYLVRLTGVPRFASGDAAADAAAHAVLVSLYPKFQAALDAQLQQLLAAIPEGSDKAEGIRIGQTVADRILALRSNDGSTDTPAPFVFGSAPGDFHAT
jgi:hypothetical protein